MNWKVFGSLFVMRVHPHSKPESDLPHSASGAKRRSVVCALTDVLWTAGLNLQANCLSRRVDWRFFEKHWRIQLHPSQEDIYNSLWVVRDPSAYYVIFPNGIWPNKFDSKRNLVD